MKSKQGIDLLSDILFVIINPMCRKVLLPLLSAAAVVLLLVYLPRNSRGRSDFSERVKNTPHPTLQAKLLPALCPAPAPQSILTPTNCVSSAEIDAGMRTFSATFKPARFSDIPNPYRIELSSGAVDTRTRDRVGGFKGQVSKRGTCPVIVKFAREIDDVTQKLIEQCGGVAGNYVPQQAQMVELTEAGLKSIRESSLVAAAIELEPADKLQPFLKSMGEEERLIPIAVIPQQSQDIRVIAAAIRRLGGIVINQDRCVTAQLAPKNALALAQLGEVVWIEVTLPLHTMTDKAHGPKLLNTLPARNLWNLTGAGQIVAHSDTGIDTGNISTLHNDMRGRVLQVIKLYSGAGADSNGHGTHTAGTVIGNGTGSSGKYKGSAPEAQMVDLAFYSSGGGLYFTNSIYSIFAMTVPSGARVHTASWGGSGYGAYDGASLDIDQAVWDNPESLPVIAASNDGTDTSPANGVIDSDSIGNTGCAKNALTVGATENDRAGDTGGYTNYKWISWGSKFSTSPISADYCTRPYDGTNQGMAAYSSRGPTDDGRIKPDITAPGTEVIATRSSLASYYGYALDYPSLYAFDTGTSMATPLVAGGALLMRQYAVQYGGLSAPTAALIKAMLIGGARSLAPGQYGAGVYQEIPTNSPNSVEGWGQANFSQSVFPTNGAILLFDRLPIAAKNATVSYPVTVLRSGSPLRIVVCWTDYPGSALQNDYDLTVTTPSSATLYPNGLTTNDIVNNVESVLLSTAEAGTYTVTVKLSRRIAAPSPGTNKAAVYVSGVVDAKPIQRHTPKISYAPATVPIPIEFLLQTASTNRPRVNYSFGTPSGATGVWSSVQAAVLSNSVYQAQIPAPNMATLLYYSLETPTTNNLYVVTTNFVSYIDNSVELVVAGSPAAYGAVSPAYGTNWITRDAPFTASAPAFVQVSDSLQAVCLGFIGTGGVPASGTSNTVSFSLSTNASLTWLWGRKYPLVQSLSIPALSYTQSIGTDWFDENSNGTTRATWEVASDGTTYYGLAGWLVDGVRYSGNPASGFAMNAAKTAVAEYISFWQDTDGNGLSDWYELRYFGTTNGISAATDSDGDGWSNQQEFLDNTDPHNNASVPTPPQITVHPVDSVQTSRPPWRVTATITDNFQVAGAEFYWKEGDGDFQMIEMQSDDGALFYANLNPANRGAEPIEYFVLGYDLLGNYDYSFFSVSDTYFITTDYVEPWPNLSPVSFPVLYTADSLSETNVTVTLSNYAGPDFVWTARVSTAQSRIAVSSADSPWTQTTNRTFEGSNVWYCGNTSTRQYPNSLYSGMRFSSITIGTRAMLKFTHWMKCELDSGTQAWDGGIVTVSTDGGTIWQKIAPFGGYPYTIVPNAESPFDANEPCFADTAGVWHTDWFDLSAFAGQTLLIQCIFGSDAATTDEGWYIATPTVYNFSGESPVLESLTPTGGTLPQGNTASATWRVNRAALVPQVLTEPLIAIFGNTSDLLGVSVPILKGNTVTASAAAGGDVLPSGSSVLFAPSNSLSVTVNALFGWRLERTVSNEIERVAAAGLTNQVFTFTGVTNDIAFVSVFAQNLSPVYGAPELWLAQYGIYGNLAVTELLDSDGDGRVNGEEFTAGTNPSDPSSLLTVTTFTPDEIVWAGGIVRTQFLQFAPALSGPWQSIYTNLPPTDLTNRLFLPIPGTGGYYRILVP